MERKMSNKLQKNQQSNIDAVRRCVCPKCKSTDLTLTELWKNHSIQFYYKNGEIVGKGNLECGDPYKVEAFCNYCNHEWRLKGITQISEVSQHNNKKLNETYDGTMETERRAFDIKATMNFIRNNDPDFWKEYDEVLVLFDELSSIGFFYDDDTWDVFKSFLH